MIILDLYLSNDIEIKSVDAKSFPLYIIYSTY